MAARVLTVVGGRPQFIKAAVVSAELACRHGLEEEIVHTGQHFDHEMSQVFFDELGIPEPAVNLGISGGTHAQMTGRMMEALESEMMERRPDMVMVYGDMNSTLAAALAAVKLHIPICHVEAGPRTHHLTNPEEANRVCVDHVSQVDCAVTQVGMDNLLAEGLGERAVFTGDPMLEAFRRFSEAAPSVAGLRLEGLDGGEVRVPEGFVYLTCHRQENTDPTKIAELMRAMAKLGEPVVYPVHPRVRELVREAATAQRAGNVLLTKPVGYLESVALTNACAKVVTDSGGLSREAFFAGRKCVMLIDFVVHPEIMVDGRCTLASMEASSILAAIAEPQVVDPSYMPYGDGRASEHIADAIESYLEVAA